MRGPRRSRCRAEHYPGRRTYRLLRNAGLLKKKPRHAFCGRGCIKEFGLSLPERAPCSGRPVCAPNRAGRFPFAEPVRQRRAGQGVRLEVSQKARLARNAPSGGKLRPDEVQHPAPRDPFRRPSVRPTTSSCLSLSNAVIVRPSGARPFGLFGAGSLGPPDRPAELSGRSSGICSRAKAASSASDSPA